MSRTAHTLMTARDLLQAGQAGKAQTLLQRELQRAPADADLNHAMAVVLVSQGRHEPALYHAARAAGAAPHRADFLSAHASLLSLTGKHAQAVDLFRRALEIDPSLFDAHIGLASALVSAGRYSQAADTDLRALAVFPESTELAEKAIADLTRASRLTEAREIAERTLARVPGHAMSARTVAFALNYSDRQDLRAIFGAHRRIGELVDAEPPSGGSLVFDEAGIDRGPDRPLRVGLLSPDFRTHSVAFFADPIFRHADRSKTEIIGYSLTDKPDAMTEQLKSNAAAWRDVSAASDDEIAQIVRADRVDILIELSGHTEGQRLGVMARRPAPITGTAIGYPNTTGMNSVGFRVVDSVTDPAPDADRWCTERLVRLDPCFLCYTPRDDAPDVSSPPCAAPGAGVTFGSFNTLLKVTDAVVEVWAKILLGVPGSRLVLKAVQLTDPDGREATRRRFADAGVDPTRVETIEQAKGYAEHLGQYGLIDLALDPFPYAGTTTTCEALWMGVPVVTVGEQTHASRVGASLLRATGLTELIAADRAEYVRLAVALAHDRARLGQLRSEMRERVRRSPLCDGPAYARRLEGALRELWRRWCRGGDR